VWSLSNACRTVIFYFFLGGGGGRKTGDLKFSTMSAKVSNKHSPNGQDGRLVGYGEVGKCQRSVVRVLARQVQTVTEVSMAQSIYTTPEFNALRWL